MKRKQQDIQKDENHRKHFQHKPNLSATVFKKTFSWILYPFSQNIASGICGFPVNCGNGSVSTNFCGQPVF